MYGITMFLRAIEKLSQTTIIRGIIIVEIENLIS